jgi:hypothetical protein
MERGTMPAVIHAKVPEVPSVLEQMLTAPQDLRCRLCEGRLTRRFNLTVLRKHDVDYFECTDCHSLQTEVPYWLDEAYAGQNLAYLDTGAVQRNLDNFASCYALSRLFGSRNVLDVGGGDGLLCRMLRDYGINCYVVDKHAAPAYAQAFTEPDFDTPDLVVALEVMEHFANPRDELDALFARKSPLLLLSTGIYAGESRDWWYLAPDTGQHVFFYSRQALNWIGRRYGMEFVTSPGGLVLFFKEASVAKKLLARLIFKSPVRRFLKALLYFRSPPGAWRDHLALTARTKGRGSPS